MPTLDDLIKSHDEKSKEEEEKKEEEVNVEEKEKEEEVKEEVKVEEKEKEEEVKEEVKEEEKKEEEVKEEVKEEEKKEEEVKEEEKKEEVKEEVKEEEKKEEKKEAPKAPREPEPKIPTDFHSEIAELKDLKTEGNNLIKSDLEKAIEKYEEAYKKSSELIPKAYKEKDYNKEQCSEIILLNKQIMSNLSLSYQKKGEYEKSIDLDLKIIAADTNYDKSYARLFLNYMNINKPQSAVYYGTLLKKNFSEETKEKYKDLIPKIEEEEKKIQKEIDEYKAKQRSETIKSILKYAIPILVLIIAIVVYFLVFKKNNSSNLNESNINNLNSNVTSNLTNGDLKNNNFTSDNDTDVD